MNRYYELMDLDSANVVGFFDTKDDAFVTILESYDLHGPAGVEDLALSEKSGQGEGTLLGEGVELLRLASEKVSSQVAD